MSFLFSVTTLFLIMMSCAEQPREEFTGAEGEVKIITIQPGHFHAALVQKEMHPQVNSKVHVYASEGPELYSHLRLIESYNNRSENPTNWDLEIYTGDDYLEKALLEKKGNVMITAGNNARKTDYILRFVKKGIHVLADKPMVISPGNFEKLIEAFDAAQQNNVLLYDIMTERSEINTILQRELSMIPQIFGEHIMGTPEEPAITKESVHYFFKYVSGAPLVRPPWFFDVEQQGEGIVDVTTHLVDLVQWQLFPGKIIDYKTDIEMLSAKRWPTQLTLDEFKRVTGLDEFPGYLLKYVNNETLDVYANGEMNYTINGKHAKVSVIWDYVAPEGAGDTHYSIMRGTKADLIIQQGEKENYRPVLYVKLKDNSNVDDFENTLTNAIRNLTRYLGLSVQKEENNLWSIVVPSAYRIGHEAHFGEVMERFLEYLVDGKLPEWEVPNMISKYYTNMKALEMAKGQ